MFCLHQYTRPQFQRVKICKENFKLWCHWFWCKEMFVLNVSRCSRTHLPKSTILTCASAVRRMLCPLMSRCITLCLCRCSNAWNIFKSKLVESISLSSIAYSWRFHVRQRQRLGQNLASCQRSETLIKTPRRRFYRPSSEASEGYVFTGICHSVTKQGEMWHQMHHGIGHMVTGRGGDGQRSTTPPDRTHPPTRLDHHPPGKHLPPYLDNTSPPPPDNTSLPIIHTGSTVNGRVVCILLECTLVTV